MAQQEAVNSNRPPLSNAMYDKLKWTAQYLLPALGTLYFALSTTWGLPYGAEVVGTITAVDLFLAGILGLSKKGYENSDAKYDGAVVVDESDDLKDVYSIELDEDPGLLKNKKEISLKIETNQLPQVDSQ